MHLAQTIRLCRASNNIWWTPCRSSAVGLRIRNVGYPSRRVKKGRSAQVTNTAIPESERMGGTIKRVPRISQTRNFRYTKHQKKISVGDETGEHGSRETVIIKREKALHLNHKSTPKEGESDNKIENGDAVLVSQRFGNTKESYHDRISRHNQAEHAQGVEKVHHGMDQQPSHVLGSRNGPNLTDQETDLVQNTVLPDSFEWHSEVPTAEKELTIGGESLADYLPSRSGDVKDPTATKKLADNHQSSTPLVESSGSDGLHPTVGIKDDQRAQKHWWAHKGVDTESDDHIHKDAGNLISEGHMQEEGEVNSLLGDMGSLLGDVNSHMARKDRGHSNSHETTSAVGSETVQDPRDETIPRRVVDEADAIAITIFNDILQSTLTSLIAEIAKNDEEMIQHASGLTKKFKDNSVGIAAKLASLQEQERHLKQVLSNEQVGVGMAMSKAELIKRRGSKSDEMKAARLAKLESERSRKILEKSERGVKAARWRGEVVLEDLDRTEQRRRETQVQLRNAAAIQAENTRALTELNDRRRAKRLEKRSLEQDIDQLQSLIAFIDDEGEMDNEQMEEKMSRAREPLSHELECMSRIIEDLRTDTNQLKLQVLLMREEGRELSVQLSAALQRDCLAKTSRALSSNEEQELIKRREELESTLEQLGEREDMLKFDQHHQNADLVGSFDLGNLESRRMLRHLVHETKKAYREAQAAVEINAKTNRDLLDDLQKELEATQTSTSKEHQLPKHDTTSPLNHNNARSFHTPLSSSSTLLSLSEAVHIPMSRLSIEEQRHSDQNAEMRTGSSAVDNNGAVHTSSTTSESLPASTPILSESEEPLVVEVLDVEEDDMRPMSFDRDSMDDIRRIS